MSTLLKYQFIFSENVGKLIFFAYSRNFQITLGEAYRTQYQQDQYFRSGYSKVKYSNHQNRLAIDLNLFINGLTCNDRKYYEVLGDYWTKLHPYNKWGGHYKTLDDIYHFELKLP